MARAGVEPATRMVGEKNLKTLLRDPNTAAVPAIAVLYLHRHLDGSSIRKPLTVFTAVRTLSLIRQPCRGCRLFAVPRVREQRGG